MKKLFVVKVNSYSQETVAVIASSEFEVIGFLASIAEEKHRWAYSNIRKEDVKNTGYTIDICDDAPVLLDDEWFEEPKEEVKENSETESQSEVKSGNTTADEAAIDFAKVE